MLGCVGAIVSAGLVVPKGVSEWRPAVWSSRWDNSLEWVEALAPICQLLSQFGTTSTLFSLPFLFSASTTSFYPDSRVRSGEFLRAHRSQWHVSYTDFVSQPFWGSRSRFNKTTWFQSLLMSLAFGSVTYLTYFQFFMFQSPVSFINLLLFYIISPTPYSLLTIANC